ncbi:MAG: hypothetical protein Q7S01_03235 [bacterium]|nr:hypothetical protein [bacterium]
MMIDVYCIPHKVANYETDWEFRKKEVRDRKFPEVTPSLLEGVSSGNNP